MAHQRRQRRHRYFPPIPRVVRPLLRRLLSGRRPGRLGPRL